MPDILACGSLAYYYDVVNLFDVIILSYIIGVRGEYAFFTAHDQIGARVTPVDEMLLARFDTPTERQLITRAVHLSHEFELMFYNTIMTASMQPGG
jgi:hypothetical protein